jgi:hypothetical protein
MKRGAAPTVSGVLTSAFLMLEIIPVVVISCPSRHCSRCRPQRRTAHESLLLLRSGRWTDSSNRFTSGMTRYFYISDAAG